MVSYSFASSVTGYILRNGGSVLVPSYPCGQVLDLFPILHVYLLNIGLPRVPIYFVSPASEAILATANISAEWYATTTFHGLSTR